MGGGEFSPVRLCVCVRARKEECPLLGAFFCFVSRARNSASEACPFFLPSHSHKKTSFFQRTRAHNTHTNNATPIHRPRWNHHHHFHLCPFPSTPLGPAPSTPAAALARASASTRRTGGRGGGGRPPGLPSPSPPPTGPHPAHHSLAPRLERWRGGSGPPAGRGGGGGRQSQKWPRWSYNCPLHHGVPSFCALPSPRRRRPRRRGSRCAGPGPGRSRRCSRGSGSGGGGAVWGRRTRRGRGRGRGGPFPFLQPPAVSPAVRRQGPDRCCPDGGGKRRGCRGQVRGGRTTPAGRGASCRRPAPPHPGAAPVGGGRTGSDAAVACCCCCPPPPAGGC